MHKVKITKKRKWIEDGFTYYECYCNGLRIIEKIKIGGTTNLKFKEWEHLKNSCRAIKLHGEDVDPWKLSPKQLVHIATIELPEWELQDLPT